MNYILISFLIVFPLVVNAQNPIGEIKNMYTQGEELFNNGDMNNSKKILLKTLETIRHLKDTQNTTLYKINSLDYLSAIYFNNGEIIKALNCADSVLKYWIQFDHKENIIISLNNLAYMYQSQKLFKEALNNYTTAYKTNLILKKKYVESLNATLINNIGYLYDEMKNYDLALKYYSMAYKIRILLKDERAISESLNNIGNLYKKTKANYQALYYLNKSMFLKQKIKDDYGLGFVYTNLSGLYKVLNQSDSVYKYAMLGLNVSEKNSISLTKMWAYESLAYYYAFKGDYGKENFALKQLDKLRGQLFNDENKKALLSMQVKYEFEKKEILLKTTEENKRLLLKAENSKIKTIAMFIGAMLLIVLVVTFYIIKLLRANKEKTRIIQLQKLESEHQSQKIMEKQAEIIASIHYASRIQRALLPSENNIRKMLDRFR